MPTQLKIDEVARLKERIEQATSLVLADYRGLTANEMVELREKFTKEGLEYRVVKDTLARIAAEEAGIEGLAEMFAGPISMALGYEDPARAFKLSDECRKTYAPNYELKGGIFEGVLVVEDEVMKYAALPTREELLAKLVMLLQSPMRALAVVLKAKIRELATVLSEVGKKRAEDPDFKPSDAAADEPETEAAPPPSEDAAKADSEPDVASEEPAASEDQAETPAEKESEEPEAEAEVEPEGEPEAAVDTTTDDEPEAQADEESEPEPEAVQEPDDEPVEEEQDSEEEQKEEA